jgi:Protein of unknown function (DUF2752)
MSRNKLYALLSTACAAGYIWLLITYYRSAANDGELGVCLFKRITSIPCPSCGSTRSVLALLKGDVIGALLWNPFGFILMTIMVISPIWILYDVIREKSTLFHAYLNSETILKRKWVAISVILIVLLNWIWNIQKGL